MMDLRKRMIQRKQLKPENLLEKRLLMVWELFLE